MKQKGQIDIDKLVARDRDEYYVLDYVFDDERSGNRFRGAVGTILRPITVADFNEQKSPEAVRDYMEDFWRQAVANGGTELGLDDWLGQMSAYEIEDLIFDLSGSLVADDLVAMLNARKAKELGVPEEDLEDDDRYEYCENVGGGRIFAKPQQWDEVFNQELLDLIAKYEKEA